jgi:hypothetical protein
LLGVFLLIHHTGKAISVDLKISELKKNYTNRFMMIASPGLLKTLEEATGTNQVNKELALLVVEQVNTLM